MSLLRNLFNKGKKEGGNESNSESTKTNKFQIIEISEYREFFKNIAREIGTTNPDLVYEKIQVYCEKCNSQYNQEMLEMLYAVGIGGMFGGARTVVMGGTKQGNDLRSGKCPQCGHTKMKINYSLDNIKTEKATSVFCVLCNTRYPIDEVIDARVTEGKIITFVCPNCKVPRAYNPSTDKGF